MTENIKEFVEGRDFGGQSFPEGTTTLDLSKLQVEEFTQDYDGEKKTRWKLMHGEDVYFAGVAIMDGLKKAIEAGATKVEVIRQGTGMKTRYIVRELKEAASDPEPKK